MPPTSRLAGRATTRPVTRGASTSVALLLAVLALLLAGVLAPSPALAHAQVAETTPVDGQVLDEAPPVAAVRFNEGVQLPTAGLKVFDASGERIDVGDATVDPDDPQRIVVSLPTDAPDGTYVVTWRAVSADGHPIKGAWLYSVGEGDEVGDDLLAALFSGGGDTPLVAAAIVTRAVGIGAVLLLAGVGLFWLVVARRPATTDEADRLAGLARTAAKVVVVAALLGVPLQALLETGLGFGALAPAPMIDVLTAPVGSSAVLRALLAGVALVLLGRGWSTGAVAAGVASALTLPLDGHSLTQDPVAIIFAGDVVHVLAAAAWTGGLLALGLVIRDRRRADDPIGAARLVAGFSRLATWSLLAVVVAGSAMAWVTVRAARALTTTGYGWTLLAKVALVAVLILIGLYNNRRLVPAVVGGARLAGGAGPTDETDGARLQQRIADGGWVRLRQTLRLEVTIAALVVALTGVLVGQQPAAQEAGVTGAFITYVDLTEELEVNLVVDPNRAGLNEVHVYLLDRTGRTVDADEVRFVMEQPSRDIGPFERVGRDAGPGHWSVVGRELAVAGEWTITVIVRTGQFDEERVTIPVTVNA